MSLVTLIMWGFVLIVHISRNAKLGWPLLKTKCTDANRFATAEESTSLSSNFVEVCVDKTMRIELMICPEHAVIDLILNVAYLLYSRLWSSRFPLALKSILWTWKSFVLLSDSSLETAAVLFSFIVGPWIQCRAVSRGEEDKLLQSDTNQCIESQNF